MRAFQQRVSAIDRITLPSRTCYLRRSLPCDSGHHRARNGCLRSQSGTCVGTVPPPLPNRGRSRPLKTARHEPTAMVLRSADAADSALLFAWTNALRACGLALTASEPLERAAHDRWFAMRLRDPDCWMRIVEHAGAPAGVVRLEREVENSAETVVVSVYIAEEARRLGLASTAIERALRDAARERGALTAIARVRLGNTTSRRLFNSLGFIPAESRADHVVLRRRVSR